MADSSECKHVQAPRRPAVQRARGPHSMQQQEQATASPRDIRSDTLAEYPKKARTLKAGQGQTRALPAPRQPRAGGKRSDIPLALHMCLEPVSRLRNLTWLDGLESEGVPGPRREPGDPGLEPPEPLLSSMEYLKEDFLRVDRSGCTPSTFEGAGVYCPKSCPRTAAAHR